MTTFKVNESEQQLIRSVFEIPAHCTYIHSTHVSHCFLDTKHDQVVCCYSDGEIQFIKRINN